MAKVVADSEAQVAFMDRVEQCVAWADTQEHLPGRDPWLSMNAWPRCRNAHAGRDLRLTKVNGSVVREIVV